MKNFAFRPLTQKSGIPPVPPRVRPKSVPLNRYADQQNVLTACTKTCGHPTTLDQSQSVQTPMDSTHNTRQTTRHDNYGYTNAETRNTAVESDKSSEDLNKDSYIDDDDEDAGSEPSLDDIDINDLPRLELRPEHLDSVPILPATDLWIFNFDATTVDIPTYQFKPALPEEYMNINFREAARKERSWRDYTSHRPEDPYEMAILDRMMELEGLQRTTELQESQRKCRAPSARHRIRSASAAGATQRQNVKSSETTPPPAPATIPDLHTLRKVCVICQQNGCGGTCSGGDIYNRHSRLDRDDVDERKIPVSGRPRLTLRTSYQNNVINLNTNQWPSTSIGRPARAKTPGGVATAALETEFENLSVNTEHKKLRDRGRTEALSKTFSSQKQNSLNDIPKEVKASKDVKVKTKRRTKSAKRRPKTALQ